MKSITIANVGAVGALIAARLALACALLGPTRLLARERGLYPT